MHPNTIESNFSKLLNGFYKWRSESAISSRIILAFAGACLIGALAQIKIYLPWTPVPITGQTLGAVLLGVLLGKWWGGSSALLYAVLGAAGIPWFAGFSGGISVLAGPTGGYIIGFIIAAMFIGHLTENYPFTGKLPWIFIFILISQTVLVYIPGLIQLGFWLYLVKGSYPGVCTLLQLGVFPFILGDLIKAAAGASIIHLISAEKSY